MAYAQSIADIIRQEAQQRGQMGVAKSGLWPQAIGQSAEGLQGALNQIAQNRTRGLQDKRLGQQIEAGGIELEGAKRKGEREKRKVEAEREAMARAQQAATKEEKVKIFHDYLLMWEPEEYRKAVEEARKQRESEAGIEKTKAETERARRPAPKQIISPGAGVLDDSGTSATYTQPFKKVDPKESTAGTGMTRVIDKGQGPRVYQYNLNTDTYDIDLGKPQPSVMMGGVPPQSQLVTTTTAEGPSLEEYLPGRGGRGKLVPLKEGAVKGAQPSGEKKAVADIETSEEKIINLRKSYKPEFVGPVQGRYNLAKLKIPGVDVSKELATFVAGNETLKNEVIKFITGAQMSEPEANRILKQIPTIEDKSNVWEAKYDLTLANIQLMKQKMKQSGYIFGKEESKPKSDPLKLF